MRKTKLYNEEESVKPNRKRTKQIVIRMTEDEYAAIKTKVDQSGLSQQDYLIKTLSNKKIIVVDGIRELIPELKRIGSNLNQLTHACNAGKADCQTEVAEIEKELNSIWRLLRLLVQGQV
jgi:hypothetical protein